MDSSSFRHDLFPAIKIFTEKKKRLSWDLYAVKASLKIHLFLYPLETLPFTSEKRLFCLKEQFLGIYSQVNGR